MSLFENNDYRWRETFFVLFDAANRPSPAAVEKALRQLGGHYEVTGRREDEEGGFESLTVVNNDDFAAMDITYISGEDVAIHIAEIQDEMSTEFMSREEREKFSRLPECTARFDIYHFEKIVSSGADDDFEDDFLDPGSLLLVLEQLTSLCKGIGIDPNSGAVM